MNHHGSPSDLHHSQEFSLPVHTVLLLGPTGVGKSPLGDLIARYGFLGRKCHHLDFGSELRRAVSGGISSEPYSSDELAFIHGVLERGLLLENEHFSLAKKIISLFLKRVGFSSEQILLLNGIPRHDGQARDMERMTRMHAVIVLACPAKEIFRRIRDNVGGDRTERSDDSVELIEKKLKIFAERTTPLIRYYEKQGAIIYRFGVSGTMTPADAYQKISALAAAHPPVALVTEPPEG